jgi:hypothetical protein
MFLGGMGIDSWDPGRSMSEGDGSPSLDVRGELVDILGDQSLTARRYQVSGRKPG